jgi:hypothetical protein
MFPLGNMDNPPLKCTHCCTIESLPLSLTRLPFINCITFMETVFSQIETKQEESATDDWFAYLPCAYSDTVNG